MRTLILGIGNTIMGDDAFGAHVARELSMRIADEDIDVRDVSFDGLNLLDLFVGYDRLIVIDAIMTENGEVGTVYRLKPENVCDPSRSAISPHHFNLSTTIEIAKRLFPDEMPEEVTVFAVAIRDVERITEEMTDRVEQAIPEVVDLVLKEVGAA